MSRTVLIGRWAVIPASKPGERGYANLQVDLYDSTCMRLELDGQRFAVSRAALQSLLDAYDDAQVRIAELTELTEMASDEA